MKINKYPSVDDLNSSDVFKEDGSFDVGMIANTKECREFLSNEISLEILNEIYEKWQRKTVGCRDR